MEFSLRHQIANSPDTLILPIIQSGDNQALFKELSKTVGIPEDLIQSDFKVKLKEVHTLYFQEDHQNKRLHLLGLGEKASLRNVIDAFRSFTHKRKTHLPESIGIDFTRFQSSNKLANLVEAAVSGIMLGNYEIGLYKTKKETEENGHANLSKVEIFIPEEENPNCKKAIEKGKAIASSQLEIFNLVNAPANKKTPQTLADWAVRSGQKYGYEVKVFNKKEIESLGLHALLAVNKGSENPPTFIIMEYKPKHAKPIKKIGLVGKGVTFDTGGLSIKPSTNMHYMKSDMGGAAAVMGTIEAAAKLQLPLHVFAVVPATDNSVDAKSIKPGDVIDSYDGKTIEVIDTDAEGRLILADGLAYIVRQFQPDILIDLATLTGSCIRTLGTYAGGLFSNNDELAAELLNIGQSTGERLWQLPLWEDYRQEIKSDVADVKNFSGNPSAGAITAAKFLELFIQGHPIWAHLDIAGVAVSDSEFSSQKSATGFGVRLLIGYLKSLVEKSADRQ